MDQCRIDLPRMAAANSPGQVEANLFEELRPVGLGLAHSIGARHAVARRSRIEEPEIAARTIESRTVANPPTHSGCEAVGSELPPHRRTGACP